MNQFFEGLASQNNAEVTSVVTQDNFDLRAGGYITINKGVVSMNISYWANLYKSSYPECIHIDDCDWDTLDVFVSGVKIDSLTKFNDGLNNMGLSSIAKGLQISDDEIRNEIDKSIEENNIVKTVFPSMKLFERLSLDEKKMKILDFSILSYEKASPYTLNKYGLSESKDTKPSLEELIKLRNELILN